MKTLMTIPIAVGHSRTIRQVRAAEYRLALKRSLLKSFQHFIVSTDWEEGYLYHKAIDKICLGVMILSIFYFCFRSGAYITAMVFQNYG